MCVCVLTTNAVNCPFGGWGLDLITLQHLEKYTVIIQGSLTPSEGRLSTEEDHTGSGFLWLVLEEVIGRGRRW